ncbi:hypothetical protein RXV95_12610 [Novosphingobium sp. ZN18A2]|uniref:hypothetical protein n=1 Tax=Novosphingobium sp. ZN18A2 TaxID=3079861 RepID=UPI0030CE326C
MPREVASAWEAAIASRLNHASLAEIDDVEKHIMYKKSAWAWWHGWYLVEIRLRRNVEAAREALLRWLDHQPGIDRSPRAIA